MTADELTRALIEETTLEDISESYRPVVEIIGIEKFIELSEYAKGDELYFPKTENIIAPARNRRIKKEWNGYNSKQLAEKYNLTTKQIGNILKDEPMIGQMSLFDLVDEEEKERRAQLITETQLGIMERQGQQLIGRRLTVLTEGFEEESGAWFGRSYMDAPDVDGRVYFTAAQPPAPGDFVEVEPAGGHNISPSVAVFLLPCVGLGLGYALGANLLHLSELAAMATAALGLAAGFVPALLMDRAIARSKAPEFSILKRLR